MPQGAQSSGRRVWRIVQTTCRYRSSNPRCQEPVPPVAVLSTRLDVTLRFILFPKFFHLTLGLFLGLTVVGLDQAAQAIPVAAHDVELIVGQLAPTLFDFSFELFPGAFELVRIHEIDSLQRIKVEVSTDVMHLLPGPENEMARTRP